MKMEPSLRDLTRRLRPLAPADLGRARGGGETASSTEDDITGDSTGDVIKPPTTVLIRPRL